MHLGAPFPHLKANLDQLHLHHGGLSSNGFEMLLRDDKGHLSSANMSAEISYRVSTHASSPHRRPAGKLSCCWPGTGPNIQQPEAEVSTAQRLSEVRQGTKALRSHLHKTKQLDLCQRVGVLHMVLCKLELGRSDSV